MMLHYLFTNDLRRNEWPDILIESAKLIRDDKVPDQNQDKSKNNYINTQQSYLCIHKGTKANEVCCNGNAIAVILNFIDHFQFPNARTQESFNDALADGMSVAPLRLTVQLLFALNQIDGAEAHISCEEFAKYIICDSSVAKGGQDVLALAQKIVSDRNAHVIMPPVPDTNQLSAMGIEWKHCPRQINELFKILQFAPFIEPRGKTAFTFVMPTNIDASSAKLFFYLVNNHKMWVPPAGTNWQGVQKSYLAYMDAGIARYQSDASVAQKDYREEFIYWMVDVEGKSKSTAENYISYLSSLNKPPTNPINNNSTWPGIYPYLFRVKSPKEVYEVGALAEFDEVFGPFRNIFDGSGCPNGANPQAYQTCVAWASQVSGNACLDSAFKAYRKFLIWREEKDNDDPLASAVDLLSIALKIFADKRYEEEWQEKTRKDGYQNVYAMADMTPEQIAAGSLDDFYNDFLLKIWAFQNGGCRNYGQLDEAGKTAYRQFVVDLKTQLKSLDAYFPPNKKCPTGMGVGMLTEIMTRFWPKSCCNYNESLIHDAMVTLGLFKGDFGWPKTPSIYQDFMGKCATILRKMEQMKLPRRPNPNNDEPPDYITVNEFLWFVHDYKDLIMEEVMKKQWKPVNSQAKKKTGSRKLSDAFANDDMLKRLAAALRTKPFAILAGHSGTGKSQLVRRLAYMTCNNELLAKEGEGKTAPGNYCMVQVKPNWHDSTDLLGYYSEMDGRHFVNTPFVEFICKAYAYPDTPFFVCLDEMNLAPVEQYFAEYLSAIESMEKKGDDWLTDPLVEVDKTGEKDENGKEKVDLEIVDQIMKGAVSTEAAAWIQAHGLTMPKNLFVVGTVNMDETTCQFSRKVLDRAMTLLMNEVKFGDMAQAKKPSEEELLDDNGLKFFLEGGARGDVGEMESKLLNGINEPLANTAFVVAYRFANEYALYEAAWAKLTGVDLSAIEQAQKEELAAKALDHVVLMKLLPRIHGERRVVEGIFKGRKVKWPDGEKDLPGLKAKVPDGLSAKMMDAILARPDEYLTFWP